MNKKNRIKAFKKLAFLDEKKLDNATDLTDPLAKDNLGKLPETPKLDNVPEVSIPEASVPEVSSPEVPDVNDPVELAKARQIISTLIGELSDEIMDQILRENRITV